MYAGKKSLTGAGEKVQASEYARAYSDAWILCP